MEQFTALKRKALEKYFSRMNDQQRKADSCCGICKVKDVNSQNCCKYRTGDNEYQEYRQQSCA